MPNQATSKLTIDQVLDDARKQLKAAGVNSITIDAQLLLAHVLKKDRSWLLAHGQDTLSTKQQTTYKALITKRAQRTPVVHLTNLREFYGINLYINEQVLTPRVETEKMVELAIAHTPQNGRLLDVGTGSGAIAIAVASHRQDLAVDASEVDQAALKVAKKNVDNSKLVNISLIESDLLEVVYTTYDTVVCNLPYLANDADLMEEVQKEPSVALFGGQDGLDIYRRFLAQLPKALRPNGYLFTECDPWQQKYLIKEATQYGLELFIEDYFILGFRNIGFKTSSK